MPYGHATGRDDRQQQGLGPLCPLRALDPPERQEGRSMKVGDRVTAVASVIDPPWVKADNRVTIERVTEEFGHPRFWVRSRDGQRKAGPYAKSELIKGWS
jgi:hypothetical protein